MPMTPVTAFAAAVGVVAVLAGAAWLRDPAVVHDVQVRYLGSRRREPAAVRRGALSRGFVLLVLGLLCVTFAVVSV